MLTRHYLVKGVVQGVSFRAHTRSKAFELGVTGWVRNKSDGSVEVMASAEPEALIKLEAWLCEGPAQASVDSLEINEVSTRAFDSFSITW